MARRAYKTWSTAWYTPLLATKSNLTTKALPALEVICTNFPLLALSSSPEAVLSLVAPWGMALPASLVPGTTWRRRTAFRAFLSSRSLLRESTGTCTKRLLFGWCFVFQIIYWVFSLFSMQTKLLIPCNEVLYRGNMVLTWSSKATENVNC